MTLEYRIGDVFDRLAEIPDGSIDLIVTSPPFLALRSYLPADHPDKAKEIGSEPTPAEFLDTLYALSAEWGRVLAPHGSICVELGDTYSGSGQGPDALSFAAGAINGGRRNPGPGWPLAKSLTGIPTLYPWGLAYGRNLLTGQSHDAGQWRIRNLIVWARPNPPVGALGDKFRPATSYITVACKGQRRYFDLDAVRMEFSPNTNQGKSVTTSGAEAKAAQGGMPRLGPQINTHAGAPPLDWHADDHPEDGDWLWKLSTQPYRGSHYATFPLTLPKRLIEAMCPLKVCTVCGKPSERITERTSEYAAARAAIGDFNQRPDGSGAVSGSRSVLVKATGRDITSAENVTVGWTDCGCPCDTCNGDSVSVSEIRIPGYDCPQCHGTGEHQWRTGIVLDPFAGSGTTLEAAQAVGRHAIGIDLDERNVDLAQQRVGMFMEVAS